MTREQRGTQRGYPRGMEGCMSGLIDEALLATLNDEERSAFANLLCAPALTLSTEGATMLELTAAQTVVELTAALLRARQVYLLATGGES